MMKEERAVVEVAATALTLGGVHTAVVVRYMKQVGITGENMGPHALRATAAISAPEHNADIAKVQEWLATPASAPPRSMTDVAQSQRTHLRSMYGISGIRMFCLNILVFAFLCLTL